MLLVAHPQLAHALFQALVIMNIVDPAVLEVSVWIEMPYDEKLNFDTL